MKFVLEEVKMRSLNPCFSGTYSRRPGRMTPKTKMGVLILVLVEHTLGEPVHVIVAL